METFKLGSEMLFQKYNFGSNPGGGTQKGETAVEKDCQENAFTVEGRHETIWIGNESGDKQLNSRDILELESTGLGDQLDQESRKGRNEDDSDSESDQ